MYALKKKNLVPPRDLRNIWSFSGHGHIYLATTLKNMVVEDKNHARTAAV